MTAAWGEGGAGCAAVISDPDAGVLAMLTGMGSLSYGELGGERMKLGLMLNDPDEEHECFSDNTRNSHCYDSPDIRNVSLGNYTRVGGSVVEGPSLSDLVVAADPSIDAQLSAELDASVAALDTVKAAAEAGLAYDQMLAAVNTDGEALIMVAVGALVAQTALIDRAVTALGL